MYAEPNHDAAAGCRFITGMWDIVSGRWSIEPETPCENAFLQEFNACNTVEARRILALEWLRLGDGHGTSNHTRPVRDSNT